MAKPKYKNSIYSTAYIEKINNMIGRQQYSQALIEFQKYFQTYPNDPVIYYRYSNFLMTLGDFKQAKEFIEKMEHKYLSMKSNFYLNKVKFRLLILEEKYFEALELLNKYPEIIDYRNLELKAFVYKMTGRDMEFASEKDSYTMHQILDYQEEAFLDHLQKHLDIELNESDCIFTPKFPLNEIIEYIKTILPTDSCKYQTTLSIYNFKYQECGHVGKYYTDFFQVAALNNVTHDILTMYPCFQPEYFSYTDLDPIFRKEEEGPKLKRVSQIDKFNQRYGLK